jgi:hypothetical protein
MVAVSKEYILSEIRWLSTDVGTELAAHPAILYEHLGKNEPLLWIADGIAWAVQRGGLLAIQNREPHR